MDTACHFPTSSPRLFPLSPASSLSGSESAPSSHCPDNPRTQLVCVWQGQYMGLIMVLAGKHHGRGNDGMEGDEGVTACLPTYPALTATK